MIPADLPDGLVLALGGTYAFLVLATLVTVVVRRRSQSDRLDEILARIRAWWVMVVVFTVAIVAGSVVSVVLFAAISVIALTEYIRMIPTREGDIALKVIAYIAIPIQYWFVLDQAYGLFAIFIPVYVFIAIPTVMALGGAVDRFLSTAGTMYWGVMLTVFAISHVSYLLVLPAAMEVPAGAAGLLLYLVALAQLNDVFQFIWGNLVGRHKIAPTVSPNKTWEGLLGGVATTTVLSVLIAPVLTPFTTWVAVAMGVGIGIFGFLGDISISAVKRDLGVKDTGTLLPGHGGILDRIDSLVFTAPLFLHIFRYFY